MRWLAKPKWVLGVLPPRVQAVPKPSQVHLFDHLRRARGDPRGPLAISMSQKVEDDFGVHRMDQWLVGAVWQGEGGGQPLPVGHRARDGHCPRASEVGGESDAGGVPAGPAPRRIGGGFAPGLRDPVVSNGAAPSCLEVGGVPSDVGVAGGQLVHAQRPGVAVAARRLVVESDLSPGDRACPGPERRHMLPEQRRASALVHHQVSRVFWLVLQRVHRHVWVVRHLRSHQQGRAAGESTGPGLARPHLHYHPLGLELRLFCHLGALVVRGHQPYRRRLGSWAQRLGPRHICVRLLVLTVREYIAEDVQQGRRSVVCRPVRGGRQTAPTAVAPDVKLQAARGHPWASVGILLSPRGVDEPRAGVPCASCVEKVDYGVPPPGVVGGLLFLAAVVEVLIGTLVQAFPHRSRPRVVVVGEGVVQPVVPVPRRRVWHRQAARVAVPQLGSAQHDDGARGGLQLDVGCPGARDGVVELHSKGGQGPGYAVDPVAPCKGCKLRDGVVYLGAYAVRTGDFLGHPGDLGRTKAERLWTSVPGGATAVCWHRVGTPVSHRVRSICRLSREASKGYRALSFATGDVVQVAPGFGVVRDEGGDVLRQPP